MKKSGVRKTIFIVFILILLFSVPVLAWAKVGVVFSLQTELSSDQTSHPGSNMGKVEVRAREALIYNLMVERGFETEKVGDEDLRSPAALAEYDTIIFPYTFLLDERQGVTVMDYVKNGGGIVTIFGVSRVFPPFTLWINFLGHRAWEWGPFSEIYQVQFVNDPFNAGFSVDSRSSGHPIIARAKSALGRSSIYLNEPEASGVEYTEPLPGGKNTNAVPFMWYSNGYPAAWATRYHYGRCVYFTFKTMDFWWHSRLLSQAGTAKELVTQAVNWAGENDGTYARTDCNAACTGKVTYSSSGILVRHYLTGTGNVQSVGDVVTSIYTLSGQLVNQQKRERAGTVPGGTLYWSNSVYIKPVSGAKYKVVIEFQDRFGRFTHREEAIVTYGQAEVPTKPALSFGAAGRVYGGDRYQTSVEVAKKGWTASDWVIVATGGNYPDALAGAGLAGAYNCPVLLTNPASLSPSVQNEINRLRASNCFILGGTAAVSENVKNQIVANTTAKNAVRLGGSNRYETAKIIAEKMSEKAGSPGTAIVATGDNFPDALAASPIAGYKKYPILLVKKDSLPAETAEALDDLGISETIVVGGTAVISEAVEGQLPDPVRKAGTNRYATAVAVANYGVSLGLSWNTVLLSTGLNYPDALTGGAYGSLIRSPMLLVDPNNLNNCPDTRNVIVSNSGSINSALILGGGAAVSDTVRAQIGAIL